VAVFVFSQHNVNNGQLHGDGNTVAAGKQRGWGYKYSYLLTMGMGTKLHGEA